MNPEIHRGVNIPIDQGEADNIQRIARHEELMGRVLGISSERSQSYKCFSALEIPNLQLH